MGAATLLPPVAVAETVTALAAASTSLSTAVTVTSPVLVVCSAAMVRVVPLFVKSPAIAGNTGVVITISVTAWLDLPESVAVTVATPPFSVIVAGVTASVTVGCASLSVVLTVTDTGSRPL